MNSYGGRLGYSTSAKRGKSQGPGQPRLLSPNQIRYAERIARQRSGEALSVPAVLLVLAGVAYNGVLAFVNAHGFYVGRSLVVLSEILILSGCAALVLGSGTRRIDGAPALLLGFFIVNAFAISLLNGAIYVEMARNAAIIALFMLVGSHITHATLTRCFVAASAVVAAVLAIEIVSVETYASMFKPAAYFEQTRDLPPAEFDELGLFGNALGFEDRFSIIKLIEHRASAIFLEQVSLGNFAIVLAIFLACNWRQTRMAHKLLLVPLIAMIVITTASRTGLGLVLAAPLAYWIAPKLNRYVTLLIAPAVLATAAIIAALRPADGDTLEGRLAYTLRKLGELDLNSLAGLNALQSASYADSGYVYVIVASSIVGLIVLWLSVSLIAAGKGADIKRCSLMTSLYVFSNLTVSGTSVFSIKTAALLWLLVGYMRAREHSEVSATDEATAPSRSMPTRTQPV